LYVILSEALYRPVQGEAKDLALAAQGKLREGSRSAAQSEILLPLRGIRMTSGELTISVFYFFL